MLRLVSDELLMPQFLTEKEFTAFAWFAEQNRELASKVLSATDKERQALLKACEEASKLHAELHRRDKSQCSCATQVQSIANSSE